MRILLISTYELGHQPLHVASPAAALLARGHDVRCFDLSVQPWDPTQLDGIEALGISVPMHTAMRLALQVAERVRELRPSLPICLYGLYAGTSSETTVGQVVDRVISGEYEPALIAWLESAVEPDVDDTDPTDAHPRASGRGAQIVHLQRGDFRVPARHLLPPLDRYARLAVDGTERLVGYVEASHGCGFNCRHCPVPVVYGGRLRIVGVDTVLADIDQLVDAGATHITFGDPDFLNGAAHSRRVVAAMHARHPELTFDCTTKVELILRHREVWTEFATAGCLFVVSAFETTNDRILQILDKGHTRSDMVEAIGLLRSHGIEIRPSLLPFTPWTSLSDLVDLMDFVSDHDLIGNVDPVHFSIRLLVPEGSLLLDTPEMAPHLGNYQPEQLSYEWTPVDPRTDGLQRQIAVAVEQAAAEGEPLAATYRSVRSIVRNAAGLVPESSCGVEGCSIDGANSAANDGQDASAQNKPRLTEAWFCCAEPTKLQLEPLR